MSQEETPSKIDNDLACYLNASNLDRLKLCCFPFGIPINYQIRMTTPEAVVETEGGLFPILGIKKIEEDGRKIPLPS